MRNPVAVVLLADPGLSHVEAVTQRRLQATAKQYRHAKTTEVSCASLTGKLGL